MAEPVINNLWDVILWAIAWAVDLFYRFAQDWGLAIILFTLVFRLIMMPLMTSQTRSSYMTQKMQPKLKEIQTKFEGDPVRIQEETQKLYTEAKFNPLLGCVPMLIQMPIFIALFQVLRNISSFMVYPPEEFHFYNIIPNLLMTPSDAWEQGWAVFIPYLVLIIIFVGATFLPMLLMQRNNDPKQRNQMLMMSIIMSVMMLFVSWGSPAGVLLFWGVSGIIAVIIQQSYMHYLRRKDEQAGEEIIEVAPVKVEVERKVKKKRPTKKK